MNTKKARRKATTKKKRANTIAIVQPDVAGIDIGSREHWVCGPARDDGVPNVQVFGTTTPELERLAAWLIEQGVRSVAMESTHVYWIPIYELLESRGVEVLLVNARQLRHVPGRKTDMADCQWLQRLHSCGLLRGSFRPDQSICRMRALQRQIGNLVEERSRTVQWMQKSLDRMNVQVHRAVTDITGKTGMSYIEQILFRGKRSADPNMDGINVLVAERLRQMRLEGGLSLEDLASRSGVSRAMLSQIETLKANPTIAVLWKIATGLGVSFSHLLGKENPRPIRISRAKDARYLYSEDRQFRSRPVLTNVPGHRSELYELRLEAGAAELAGAHPPGSFEHLYVMSGRLELEVDDEKYRLKANDGLFFPADKTHRYEALGSRAFFGLALILYAS